MLTLAHATTGPVTLALGAGELRQAKPFGYKRTEGLKRLEDVFCLMRRLIDEETPFTQETNFWHYKNAFIGNTLPPRMPEIWALGGGPILLDIAARYADGFEVASPQSIQTPEQAAEIVTQMRQKVEGYGRDPDAFGFGLWSTCICHDDPEVIEQVLANPIITYFSGQFGRLASEQWTAEGIQPVMPEGWHYAMKWAPFEQTSDEVWRIVSQTSPEMVRKSFHIGTPAEIAALDREFAEAGITFFGHLDMTPLVLGPADGEASIRRASQVAALTRAAASTKAAVAIPS
jgi:phthiodiolone/phenolphthiodiolone dimycocerosates ketoreductase